MFDGLIQWCSTDPAFERELFLRSASARSIRRLTEPDYVDRLTCAEFQRTVCRPGCVLHADGTPVEVDRLQECPPGNLVRMLEDGDMAVGGNFFLSPMTEGFWRSPQGNWRDGAPQDTLPGLCVDDDERLRDFVWRLLEVKSGREGELMTQIAREEGETAATIASIILSVTETAGWAILDNQRVLGLQRLELLSSIRPECHAQADHYQRIGAAVRQVRAFAKGAMPDPAAADLLLCRLAQLREPQAWKIACGLNRAKSDEASAARRCIDGGFAAIAPDDPDDVNIARLKRLIPGDCVVMHLRGRIGAIGRVTRPYYEIEREGADALDRRWWRRVGVEWIKGERDYGNHLSGAHQRFSVVRIEPQTLGAIAGLYRHDPGYDRLIRPMHGAWLFCCDETRWRTLASLDRPLPLRDQWTVQIEAPEDAVRSYPEQGDLVYVYRDSEVCGGDATPGICAAGRVIGDCGRTARAEDGSRRIDLIYEYLPEDPMEELDTGSDQWTDAVCPPRCGKAARLQPETASALARRLEIADRRYFVLIATAPERRRPRGEICYRLGPGVSGCSEDLLSAAGDGSAHCLIYNGSPDNALVGFAGVLSVSTSQGQHDLHLDLRRFSQKVHYRTEPLSNCLASASTKCHDRPDDDASRVGWVRTVLPVSAYDFYRVLGAGMVKREVEDTSPDLDQLAENIGAPVARLEEMERLLRKKGQMILYGPPGTGKTWLALQLAGYLARGCDERWQMVQFHTGYSYEDFIEGVRPRVITTPDGLNTVDYPLVPGSFRLFCDRARRDLRNTYVFVIDEINRARVAQVFGELMLALEYRGREVQLAYARAGSDLSAEGGSFSVPPNVLVLGTMNTADRSTALVDFALRRRFVFYPLYPDDPGLCRPIFERWLSRHAPDASWVARLHTDINAWLSREMGRHLLIGHTYFMRDTLTEDDVREIWRFEIYPLLEEYFAGAPEQLARVDIDELIANSRAPSEPHGRGAVQETPGSQFWPGEGTCVR
jgi:MoxR-like ATPase